MRVKSKDGESKVSRDFANGFLSVDLETQISHCHDYEILHHIERITTKDLPILEAGAGSGRWVIYFHRKGYRIIGIDWSKELCAMSKNLQSDLKVLQGDIRVLPFPEGVFGSIIALGSIEHVQEGPQRILDDFYRCLCPNGRVLITVPYFSPLRRLLLPLRNIFRPLRASRLLRIIFRKSPLKESIATSRDVTSNTIDGLYSDIAMCSEGWFFYQYRFTKEQIERYLKRSNFIMEKSWFAFEPEGILHDFGRLAGKFDYTKGHVSFSCFGKIILKYFSSAKSFALMICCIARKKG